MYEVRSYQTTAGDEPVTEWLSALNDAQARARINARIARLAAGNFGDCKPLRGGVWELRVDWGPGYRVYYARIGRPAVLLIALRHIAEAYGMAKVARKTGLAREALYRALSPKGNPTIKTLNAV